MCIIPHTPFTPASRPFALTSPSNPYYSHPHPFCHRPTPSTTHHMHSSYLTSRSPPRHSARPSHSRHVPPHIPSPAVLYLHPPSHRTLSNFIPLPRIPPSSHAKFSHTSALLIRTHLAPLPLLTIQTQSPSHPSPLSTPHFALFTFPTSFILPPSGAPLLLPPSPPHTLYPMDPSGTTPCPTPPISLKPSPQHPHTPCIIFPPFHSSSVSLSHTILASPLRPSLSHFPSLCTPSSTHITSSFVPLELPHHTPFHTSHIHLHLPPHIPPPPPHHTVTSSPTDTVPLPRSPCILSVLNSSDSQPPLSHTAIAFPLHHFTPLIASALPSCSHILVLFSSHSRPILVSF